MISEVLNLDELDVREMNVKRKANQVPEEMISEDFDRNSRETSNSLGKNYCEEKRIKVENDDGCRSPSDCIDGVQLLLETCSYSYDS